VRTCTQGSHHPKQPPMRTRGARSRPLARQIESSSPRSNSCVAAFCCVLARGPSMGVTLSRLCCTLARIIHEDLGFCRSRIGCGR
jgi:hypothetical protein